MDAKHIELSEGYEKRRLQEVEKYAFLEHQPNYSSDHIVELASDMFGTKTALITLVEQGRQWFQARVGMDLCETSRDVSFCAHALVSEDVLVVLDAHLDARFANNELVTGEPYIRFYAGAPLVTPRGYVIGTLCLIDDRPRTEFSEKDGNRLQSLAKLVIDQFELKRLTEAQKAAICLNRTTVDGIINVTLPGKITSANDAASKILGYDKDAFSRLSLSALLTDQLCINVSTAAERFQNSGKDHATIDVVEATLKTKSGLDAPIEFSAGIWASDGDMHMGIIIRDIAERKRREASFQMLFERNPLPMWIFDAKTFAFVGINGAACDLYGFSQTEMLQRSVLDMRLPQDRDQAIAELTCLGDVYEPSEPKTHVTAKEQRIRVMPFARRIQYYGKECVLAAMIDVTQQERAAIELKSTRIFLDAIVESIPSMVFVKDVQDGRFVLLNKAGEQLLGKHREDVIGKTDFDFFPTEDAERFIDADRAVVTEQKLITIENEQLPTPRGLRSLRTQKVGVPDADGNPRYLLGISEDVTERLEIEERNRHLSRHDLLTALPNRLAFQDMLSGELVAGANGGKEFALLMIDLDRFKAVNDSLGHHAGDDLLRQVAARLLAITGVDDIVARLGGDEFALINRSWRSGADVALLAARITNDLARSFTVDGQDVTIGCSIGIATYPQDGVIADTLLKRADLALYAAKEKFDGGYMVFNNAMEKRADRERLLRHELRFALEKGQFNVVYQPVVDTETGKTVCCEALLRWSHPTMGSVAPTEFIPAAESAGLMPCIGRWVLQQACTEAVQWPKEVKVAVNLSPQQFTGFALASDVAKSLEISGLASDRLELEITEGIFLRDSQENLDILNQLKTLGVRIALDDFGTGYSSLSYLRSFSFDKIKIDRSFVSGLPQSSESMAIVRAVIGLGRSFHATITAEGVESVEQLDVLANEGCDQCQGYYFSKPVDTQTIKSRLRSEAVERREVA
ncbi:bifunctional diguanylate cyclase/phosphodiesterase [Agrobacterium vaccinii]|uniref:bifunctional diguanylate cyclase/phosphodiesterase n=1 Tax=Agrobacterium vaccinii TaxID=2735528 RepID=UPI001E489825|nr:EAL domain-containing protein [Agrobacterium vaccinii]UHS59769.1 EAL domain-containing protein [Agrobacterium vaccinii]